MLLMRHGRLCFLALCIAFYLIVGNGCDDSASVSGSDKQDTTGNNDSSFTWIEQTFYLGDAEYPITMIWMTAGSFMMGASTDGGIENEFPQHLVTFSDGFWIGKYEVTQAQWESVTGDWPFGFDNNPDHPAEMVSWMMITEEYLPTLGEGWRLPTEAEWEYACRGGVIETEYWFGQNPSEMDDYGWYRINSDSRTHPVGQKVGNPYGLFDVYGNVFEWCSDWYDAEYYALSPALDPTGPEEGDTKVIRGGSWACDAYQSSSQSRYGSDPYGCRSEVGFRLVKEE